MAFKNMFLPQEITTNVKLQDRYGRAFPPGMQNIKLDFFCTNPNIVQGDIKQEVQNTFLSVKSLNGGSTLCRISFENDDNVFDIFEVHVGISILPKTPFYVHEGGRIKFQIFGKNSLSENTWKSSNPLVLEVGKHDGLAKVLGKKDQSVFIIPNDEENESRNRVRITRVSNIESLPYFTEIALDQDYVEGVWSKKSY